jgi:hypothetical protein
MHHRSAPQWCGEEMAMPHVLKAPKSLINLPLVGGGDCVDLIKEKVPGMRGRPASTWREGKRVEPGTPIAPGTAIATFVNGKYPIGAHTGQHAAIFIAYAGSAIWVIDQWKKKKVIDMRPIRPVLRGDKRRPDGTYFDASNNAAAFSVIE